MRRVLDGERAWAFVRGDMLERLALLPDNSIDAVVTDPPYGLSFMGKNWDHGVPGKRYWQEVMRVLKPGGHATVFGGTRTFHRLACALEDAGFEIRDCLMWVYGCLSDDTEILVNGRWEHYSKAIAGSRVLAYDPIRETYQWEIVQDQVVYDYCDTAFRVESDRTDQIVSRNHRCLVEREGKFVFQFAEACQSQESVPVLESVSELLRDLSLSGPDTGGTEHTVQPCVCGDTPVQDTEETTLTIVPAEGEDGHVRGVSQACVEARSMVEACQETNMLTGMQRGVARGGVGEARTQGAGLVECGSREIVSSKDDGRPQSGVEGRGYILSQARQLQADQVRPVSPAVCSDGEAGRLRDGTPPDCRGCDRSSAAAHGSGTSCRSRSAEQRVDEPDTVYIESGSQTVRGAGYTVTDVARVTPFHYVGKVWCVRVPSGAFVARRNGKVFVTGNSGFPKSMDVSKAIDKAAGAKRATGPVDPKRSGRLINQAGKYETEAGWSAGNRAVTIDPPATADAQKWNGWGTALKPAWEPVLLVRKPLDEKTVAKNVLKHGTGALNIDGTRVRTGEKLQGSTVRNDIRGGAFAKGHKPNPGDIPAYTQSPQGRWPANVVLSHAPGCACTGTRKVKFSVFVGKNRDNNAVGNKILGARKKSTKDATYADADGTETIEKWDCVPDCPIRLLNEQSGQLKSGAAVIGSGGGKKRGTVYSGEMQGVIESCFADTGGASRFFYNAKTSRSERNAGLDEGVLNNHPTVKPVKVMRWLCTMITPPGGVVLDPFCGSGSTGVAALKAGFRFIGIDLCDDPNVDCRGIATARMRHVSP